MADLYNTVLETYVRRFDELPVDKQFHFASRLYLWQQLPQATVWLERLEPEFTANGRPEVALSRLAERSLTPLRSDNPRRPYFERHSRLRLFEALLFRALFLQTVYGLDGPAALKRLYPNDEFPQLARQLLADPEALAKLSSFSVNFLLLSTDIFGANCQLNHLLDMARHRLKLSVPSQRRAFCYFVTHLVIAESRFYHRPVPAQSRAILTPALVELEDLIDASQTTADIICEFLVCCRLADYQPRLKIPQFKLVDGFIAEPGRTVDRHTLALSEHRNVLFLMSRTNFQPLLSASRSSD